ncbi:hypothetical protein [Streptomyces sp. NPDC059850]|uniref:hypothetical protein n=1 Tax=Streptomyces sp. NPDC059850 TaxID=3346970 RepID=UPI003655BCB3
MEAWHHWYQQRRLDAGSIPEKDRTGYLAAVAEAAEVAGWLLFDAAQWDAARTAFLESHMLARHAGDRSMQWFALAMLAMLDIERGRPGEVLELGAFEQAAPTLQSAIARATGPFSLYGRP